ncbi:hypothetical protein HC891_14745 [Candidatus Gracilibacteria bacterium]|nr:hypothetical protein [Candidatus Gracilibacteria bacterium]
MTLEETLRGAAAWQQILEENQFNDPAPPGTEFVLARFSGRWIADAEAANYIFDSYFTAVDAQGVEVEQGVVTLGKRELSTEVYPGGRFEGWVAKLVPSGDAEARIVFKATSSNLDPDGFDTRYFQIE